MTGSLAARLSALCLAGCLLGSCRHDAPTDALVEIGTVTILEAPRLSPGAYGREGDLMLEAKSLGVLTFAASPDIKNHRPIRGALVDIGLDAGDHPDPLLTWRPGWRGSGGVMHVGPMDVVEACSCSGARGVHLAGTVDGVRLETTVCPVAGGYRATTTVPGLPDGAGLADEVNAGTAHALAAGQSSRLDGDRASPFFGIGNDVLSLLVESPQMHVVGKLVHIGEQTFQSPFTLTYPGTTAIRTLRVIAGDNLALLAEVVGDVRRVHVGINGESGQVAVQDEAGKPLVLSPFSASGRDVKLPVSLGADLVVYDEDGVQAGRATLESKLDRLVVDPPPRAVVTFHYVDGAGASLPVHVSLRGLDGTRDPIFPSRDRVGVFPAGRSLYLVSGGGTATLAPGRYRATATHGTAFTLAVTEVSVAAGDHKEIGGALREAYADPLWTSGDFHLHAAPSPDAPVSLDARVASLVCEGVDLAVATDHNRVTDYAPSVARLGLADRIVTIPGDEITSYGATQWGHFNLYPLKVGTGAPEEVAAPYFDLDPAPLFAAAHAYGDARAGDAGKPAHFVQVNHPRMEPRIGYFDLTHLDPKTGAADATFSADFEAVEAFNGFWVTNPAKIREGATDLVALARRGIHVAATGNSDSHHLLYEEAGYPRTYVHTPREPLATRAERVFQAMRQGDTTVTSGPLVEMTVDDAPIGSVVVPKVAHSVKVHVRVSAPAWVPVEHVEIWHDDQVAFQVEVTRAPVDGVRYEADTVLAFPVDGTVLAYATADSPLPDVLPYPNAKATGFTGLVYIDVNGDGKVDVPARP